MIGLVVSAAAGILSLFQDFEIRPRTGEYYLSTRVPYTESYGMRFYDLGAVWAHTLVAPVVLCPLGLTLAAVDTYALSPVWDTLCLPYDAIKAFERDADDEPPAAVP
ncbi:MAG: hypothetical protein ACI4RA_07600 [Kiritimatiellia bacterium]